MLWVAASLAFAAPVLAADDLTTLSLEQLFQLTVVGASKYEQKQSEVAAAVSVITRQEIRSFGWRTLDEALASLPGVYTSYDRQYVYLGARGLGLPGDYSKRVLVTIDGNRANDPGYDGGPVGQQLPLDMDLVERIEFIPGPGGAVYGQNAMFGVVNIVTRRGSDLDGGELALAGQSPQSLRAGRVSWGRRLDNGLDVLMSVSAMRSRGQDRTYDFGAAGISGVATGLDGEKDRELFVRLAAGDWSFGLMHADRRKDDPAANYLSDPLVPGQYQTDGYTLGQLAYQGRFLDGALQVSGRLFAGEERYRSTLSYGGTALSFPETSNWYGIEARLLSTVIERHKLMFGVEAQDNVRYNQSILDAANPANDIYIPGSGYRIGVYAQDEWQVADSLTATLGLRMDRNSITGTHSSPRAALIWQASAATTLKALSGRAHRAPNTLEHDYYDGVAFVANPSLRGERIDTLELVVDHRVGSDLTLRASVYQWTLHDLITQITDTASGLTQYQSGDAVKARGLELSADKTWSQGARLRGSVSLQSAAYAHGEGLLNSPKLLGKLNASSPLPWLGLHAGYEWRYDARRLSVDGSRLGGYAVSNLTLSTAALAKGLELSLSIHNLLDKRYAQPGAKTNWQNALEQDGRSVRAQLICKF
ncbi:MAG: TonB-dependent receptor [Ideonella sp.]|nr:TonB-dependent receptor [Ideonella sp.]